METNGGLRTGVGRGRVGAAVLGSTIRWSNTMRFRSSATLLAGAAGLFVLATNAAAQYSSTFEGLSASAAGTVLTGQDGYYIPAGTTSVDFLAYTYAGNALGAPSNPGGAFSLVLWHFWGCTPVAYDYQSEQ